MGNLFHRSLLFCLPLLILGCGDVNDPTIASPGISTTAITPTSVSLSWNKASDGRSDTSALVYKVYLSGPNPAYQSFDTIAEVEAGTLVQTLIDASSITISSGIVAGNTYYINIVVEDEEQNQALYDPHGEFFHANLISYYPFTLLRNGDDVAATANNLAEATGYTRPGLTLDRFGHPNSAYNFNSDSSQCLQSANPVGANLSSNHSRSVSFWVKSANLPAGTARAPFAWGNGSADGSNFGAYEGGVGANWFVWLWGTADVLTTSLATSNWEHWVIGYDSATDLVFTYKNGVVVNDGDAPAVPANTVDTPLYVGCGMVDVDVLGNLYKGIIDDVRVFDQLLGPTEVANLYAVTRP